MAKQTEAAPVGEQLIVLLSQASESDVTALDEQIVAKERELDSLRAVRRMVAIATGVLVPKKPGGKGKARASSAAPKPAAGGGTVSDDRRMKCARYILRNGATTAAALCRLFDIPTGSQTATLEHPWFTKTDAGIDLTPTGRQAAASS